MKIIEQFPAYTVDKEGNVWSSHTNKFLKPFLVSQTDLYLAVKLCRDCTEKTVSVHRLVAETYIPNPLNLATVNHKDGNKQNNCVDNLEWMTQGDNKRHAFETGISEGWWKGDIHSRSTFTNQEVHEICEKFSDGVVPKDIAKPPSKLYNKLFRIYNRDNWISISKDYNW